MPRPSYPRELNFPWPFPEKPSTFYKIKSLATVSFVYLLSKSIFFGINKLLVKNKQNFVNVWEDRSRPLITIANHRCNVDDPLIWSMLTFKEFFRNIGRFRYTLAAHNICFTKPFHTRLFSLGKCVPCVRGAGVFQTGVDYCVNMLSQNAWVHIFPEGRVTKAPIRIKWGVARLIMESKVAPILLPIWINGMQNISPESPPYYPKIGNIVEVIVGEPIDTSLFLDKLTGKTELEKRKEVADIVQRYLFELGGAKPALGPPPPENERII